MYNYTVHVYMVHMVGGQLSVNEIWSRLSRTIIVAKGSLYSRFNSISKQYAPRTVTLESSYICLVISIGTEFGPSDSSSRAPLSVSSLLSAYNYTVTAGCT